MDKIPLLPEMSVFIFVSVVGGILVVGIMTGLLAVIVGVGNLLNVLLVGVGLAISMRSVDAGPAGFRIHRIRSYRIGTPGHLLMRNQIVLRAEAEGAGVIHQTALLLRQELGHILSQGSGIRAPAVDVALLFALQSEKIIFVIGKSSLGNSFLSVSYRAD